MLSLVFAVLMRGRPPIGEEFFIFYYTGIIRYSGANGTNLPPQIDDLFIIGG
jgi:hypothetical protein